VRSWKEILHVGVPSAGTAMLQPLSMALVMRMVAVYGTTAMAAVGAGNRVEALAMMAMWALSSVMLPFVGQNRGAGLGDRVRDAAKAGSLFSLGWGGACMVALAAAAGPIGRIFSDDPQVLSRLRLYLHVLPIGYGLCGASMLGVAFFNGLGRPMVAAGLNLVRMFVLYVPLAWVGSKLYGLTGLFVGICAANMIAGALSLIWMRAAWTNAAGAIPTGNPPTK
jgi:Na+-driven multidrug efflux pump